MQADLGRCELTARVLKMLKSWKPVLIILAILAAVVGIAAFDLRCSSAPQEGTALARVRDELAAGKAEYRTQRADEMAVLARDLRVLAKRYVEQGDKKKAQRAIGAAQELDRRIAELRGESNEPTR